MRSLLMNTYLSLTSQKNRGFIQKSYQIELRNGELIKQSGFTVLNNQTKRSRTLIHILITTPIFTLLESWIYFTIALICSIVLQTDLDWKYENETIYWQFWLPFILQYFADLSVKLCDKFKMMQIDSNLNSEETKILKQWDECITFKEIIKKVKEKALQKPKTEDQSQVLPSIKQNTGSLKKQNSDQEYRNHNFSRQQSQIKGSQEVIYTPSVPMITKPAIQSKLKYQFPKRSNSRQSIMSPLIHEDMALKLKFIQEQEKDPAIITFKEKVPCLFEKAVIRTRTNTMLKIKQMEDKIDLIKIIDNRDIKIGDVILLERNQIALCDILILYCNDANLNTQAQLCDYSPKSIRKPLFHNRGNEQNLAQIKKGLSLSIFLKDNQSEQQLGYLQLKKDPQPIMIMEDNLLYFSEKLQGTPWIIGIVVKLGQDCYSKAKKGEISIIQKSLPKQETTHNNHWFIILYLLIFGMILILLSLLISSHTVTEYRVFIKMVIQTGYHMIFSMPHLFFVIYKLISIIQIYIVKFIMKIDVLQIKAFNMDKYIKNRFVSLEIDSLIDNTIAVNCIIYQNKLCEFQEPQLFTELTEFVKYKEKVVESYLDSREYSIGAQKDSSYENIIQDQEENIPNLPNTKIGRFFSDFSEEDLAPLQVESQSNNNQMLEKNLEFKDQQSSSHQLKKSRGSKVINSSISVNQQSKNQIKYLQISHFLCEIFQGNEKFNITILQLALNHITFSKLLITQTGEEKIKNNYLNQVDYKQIQIAKCLNYEFICFNNCQQYFQLFRNNESYILSINDVMYAFNLIDVQLDMANQRLYMLFEMPVELQPTEQQKYLLFLRETNLQKKEIFDEKSNKNNLDIYGVHQIHYSYCEFNQEEADMYLKQVHESTNALDPEQQQYQLIEPLIKQSLILGFKYNVKFDAKEFATNLLRSHHQLFLFSNSSYQRSLTICQQAELVHPNNVLVNFNQQNDEDLRAYLKKVLQDVSGFFYDSLNTRILNSKTLLINNKSQTTGFQYPQASSSFRNIDDKNQNKIIVILIDNETCKRISSNIYVKNHLSLLFQYSKLIVLYQAQQDSINNIQFMQENPGSFFNILTENQSNLQCMYGQQVQIALLQQFENQQKVHLELFTKYTFFSNLIKLLKQQLTYQKSKINELLIQKGSDLILYSFEELQTILFIYSPMMHQLIKELYLLSMERSIFICTLIFVLNAVDGMFYLDTYNLFIEVLFYQFVQLLVIYVATIFNFLSRVKQLCQKKENMTNLKFITRIKEQKGTKFQIILKSIIRGLGIGLLICFTPNYIDNLQIITTMLIIIYFNDITSSLIDIQQNIRILGFISTTSIYFLYLYANILYPTDYLFLYLARDIWFMILICILFSFQLDLIFELILNYKFSDLMIDNFEEKVHSAQNIPVVDKIRKSSTIHAGSGTQIEKIDYLQQQVNRIFENIEFLDVTLQKILQLSKKKVKQTFGIWTTQLFEKAQSIFRWKRKSNLQTLKLIILQSTQILLIYIYGDQSYLPLIIYIVSVILLLFIQLIIHFNERNSKQILLLEVIKYYISSVQIFSTVWGLLVFKTDQVSYIYTHIIIIFILSSKIHPIYNFKLYALPIIVNLILYIVMFLLTLKLSTEHFIPLIVLLTLFSVQQYMIKSYFIILEEDQADNQLNFIDEKNKINDILGILLPKFIRNRLNETDQYNIHQNQGQVAIVFCDICQFDLIIMEEQHNIISFLDDLFRKFDQFCSQCGVQKIETVGKTYMAAAGLRACEQDLLYLSQTDPVQRALNLAEMMMNYIRSKTWGNEDNKLIGKIGIHYGNAISGVIGFHKPQFSLIGDTVNTTSRICSTGQEDKIILSEQAFDQLKNETIEFQIRYVEMKGLGQKPTYVYVQKNSKMEVLSKSNSIKGIPSQNMIRKTSAQQHNAFRRRTIVGTQRKQEKNYTKISMFRGMSGNNVNQIAQGDESQASSPNNSISFQHMQSKQFSEFQEVKQEARQVVPLTKSIAQQLSVKFELEPYQSDVDKFIDYQQLLNAILIKNENNFETKLIKETSFLQLLKMSYYQSDVQYYLEFQSGVFEQSKLITEKFFQIYFIYNLIKQFCFISIYSNIDISLIVLGWIACFLNLFLMIVVRQQLNTKQIIFIELTLLYQSIIAGLYYPLSKITFLPEYHNIEIIFIQCIFCNIQSISFWEKLTYCILSFLIQFIIILSNDIYVPTLLFIIICTIFNIIFTYYLEEQQVQCFNQKKIFEGQQSKETQLIQYLLPKHILQTFLDDQLKIKSLSDHIDNLTILFADIAGFTEYSNRVTPEQVLQMLKNLFVEFDRKCFDLNVYKLYTIGDCYVVIGMIDYENRNPVQEAKNVIDLGFEMIKIIKQVRKQINFDGLDMRIGIHTGSVFGGVMGTDIVRYDIYGPDVLIANKMESNGVKGQIQVSETTKDLLETDFEDFYDFELHTTVSLSTIQRNVDGYFAYKLEEDKFDDEIQIKSQGDQNINLSPANIEIEDG